MSKIIRLPRKGYQYVHGKQKLYIRESGELKLNRELAVNLFGGTLIKGNEYYFELAIDEDNFYVRPSTIDVDSAYRARCTKHNTTYHVGFFCKNLTRKVFEMMKQKGSMIFRFAKKTTIDDEEWFLLERLKK